MLSLLPGERHRETVVTPEQEQKYLKNCPEPLKSIATVLADSGMRPEECYRMRWENINWQHGRNGAVLVTHGKTVAARRSIPMTPRVRFILEARWEFAEKPAYGWVACPDPMRPRQPCQLEETARPCVQGSEC